MKRGMYSNKGDNSKFIFARIMPLMDLEFLEKFLYIFFHTLNITKHIYLELLAYLHYEANKFKLGR